MSARSERAHGTRAKYVAERCRCDECRAVAVADEANRRRQIAYGRWQPYVDAEPARQHVRALQAAGVGLKQVTRVSGVSHGAITKLIYGDARRGMPPSRRIRPETERKILAVTPDALADGALVDATGTRRRLQALVAIGWSQRKLAGLLKRNNADFARALSQQEQVTAGFARACRALYDELWHTPPAHDTHHELIAYNRVRRYAAAYGWAPPQAWDDEDIDDPAARPEGVSAPGRRSARKLPSPEDLQFLIDDCGETLEHVASRFGVKVAAVRDALRRDAAAAEVAA